MWSRCSFGIVSLKHGHSERGLIAIFHEHNEDFFMTKAGWFVLGVLLVADCAVFGYFFSQTHSEYENFRNREQTQSLELEQAKNELSAKQVYHRRSTMIRVSRACSA